MEVAQAVNGAVLAIGARPDLLDRRDQARGAVGDDQPWRGEPAADQIAAELEPVLLGLARPQAHGNQLSVAVFGDSPGADHALLRAARADRQVDRVEEQHDQVDVVERAATERLEPLVQLRADRRHGRLRGLPEPGLFAQRLDVAHRQAAHEPADHQRLQRVGPQQPLAVPLREQLRDERDRRLADLRDLDPQLTLPGLQVARAEPVALPRPRLRLALIASATQPGIELLLDRPLDDQPSAEPRELAQHLLRVIDQPSTEQLVDLSLYLRRRRYGASHGVGLLHRLAGLEGTYAVATTAPGAYLQQSLDATLVAELAPLLAVAVGQTNPPTRI